MTRSDLPGRVLTLAGEYDMLPEGGLVLCAVSGGLDSMCLLTLLARQAPVLGFRLAAAHFHHGLRGADADADEAFVRDWCESHGIPCHTGRGDVAAWAGEHGQSVEEAGRRLRYAFLEKTADEIGADRIATAHHADDDLETLLLNLTRGTGLAGLCGIAPRQGRLVRPLLRVSREMLEQWAAKEGVPFRQDATNDDPHFTRNRLRHEVIPVLRSLNPRLTEHTVQTIDALRADEMCLRAQAMRAVDGARPLFGGVSLHRSALLALPAAVAQRAVRLLVDRLPDGSRRDLTAVHYHAILDLVRGDDPSAHLDLPHGMTADRVGERLLLTVGGPVLPTLESVPMPREWGAVRAGDWRITCTPVPAAGPSGPDIWYLKPEAIGRTACIRARQTGDVLRLPGRGSRSLKRAMIDAKLPRLLRDTLPVLADGDGVIAAAGLGCDERRRAPEGAPALRVACTADTL